MFFVAVGMDAVEAPMSEEPEGLEENARRGVGGFRNHPRLHPCPAELLGQGPLVQRERREAQARRLLQSIEKVEDHHLGARPQVARKDVQN